MDGVDTRRQTWIFETGETTGHLSSRTVGCGSVPPVVGPTPLTGVLLVSCSPSRGLGRGGGSDGARVMPAFSSTPVGDFVGSAGDTGLHGP